MDPEFDPNEYLTSTKQIGEYNAHIKHKVISKPFCCDLSLLSDFPCIEVLERHNLETLFNLKGPIFPNLVRTFYTNMEYPTNTPSGFKTKVLGVSFSVTPTSINRILDTVRPSSIFAASHRAFRNLDAITETQVMEHVLTDALVPQSFPGVHVLKKVDLSLNMQVFAELVQSILLPRKGHMDTLTLLDVWVMGALGLDVPLDIGYLIARYMHIARDHPQQSLPHGCLITEILHHHRVPIDPDEPTFDIPPRQHITISTFKAKLWEKVDGRWQLKTRASAASSSKRPRVQISGDDAAEDSDPAAPAASSSHLRSQDDERHQVLLASLSSLSDSVQRLSTSMESRFERLDQRLDDQDQRLQRMERKMDSFAGDL